MVKIQQYTLVCAPTPFQKAAAAAMECDITSHVADYRKKRDLIYNGLKDKFEIARPEGAFYAFVKAPGGNVTPILGILTCLYLMLGLPQDTWIRLFTWLAIGRSNLPSVGHRKTWR